MNIIIIVLAIVTLYLYIQKYIKVILNKEESVDMCVRRLCPKHWSALEEALGQLRDSLHIFLQLSHAR